MIVFMVMSFNFIHYALIFIILKRNYLNQMVTNYAYTHTYLYIPTAIMYMYFFYNNL